MATPWVDGLTIGQILRETARKFPDRDALVFPALDVRWTWGEVDCRVDRAASGLLRLGVEPGEKVGIWSMNAPEWVIAQFAVARIGAVLVNVNPAYRLHELEDALRLVDASTLIVGLPFKTSDFVAMTSAIVPELAAASDQTWRSAALPELRRVVAIGERPGAGWITWDDLDAGPIHPELAAREARSASSDVANIQFTSGTTGLPKGAMLTHRNILMNSFCVGQRVRYTEADRVCVPVPFYHCFGSVLGSTVCLVYGSAIVVPAPTFDPGATLKAVHSERCTSLYGVPTMFVAQLEQPDFDRYDLSSLRTGIMAGSPCPLPLMRAVIERMGAKEITIGYGLTEASPILTQTSADDSIEVRVGTVGSPIPGVEIRLIDPTTGEDVPPGMPGEVLGRGHGIIAGYYNNPEATARSITTDGWLHTGDLGLIRPDGNYRIVGRSKEIIIRGGENIYPPEIEEYLHHHPAVAEVAIVGLPDDHYGEVVSAWVVPRTGAAVTPDDLRTFCQGQIAHYKIPKYVEIVDSLPKTVTGKVRKHILKDRGIERFGLQDAARIPTA